MMAKHESQNKFFIFMKLLGLIKYRKHGGKEFVVTCLWPSSWAKKDFLLCHKN